jgi:hypothetical protein
MTKKIVLLLTTCAVLTIPAQNVSPTHPGLLVRDYREGEQLTYRMKGSNENWRYEIEAAGVVKKDSQGQYFEEYAWSQLSSNGAATTLSPESTRFRQILSLDPAKSPAVPNLSGVSPMLIGPITDLLTFYVDLWLVSREGKLSRGGDRFYRKQGTAASWADGVSVVLGEDSIDFDITLTNVDDSAKVATLLVRHVPPQQPQVRFPAAWMREPVAGTPNNWVQVTKKDKTFVAASGKETFDVRLNVSTADGRILSGAIENLVQAQERNCRDAALTSCGEARPQRISRRIEIALER